MAHTKPIQTKDFDTAVRPQDDFYRYVNGGWLKRNKIPPTKSRWGSFDMLHEQNQKRLKNLIEDLSTSDKGERKKMRALYYSSMDMKRRNKQGLTYLLPSVNVIQTLQSTKDFTRVLAYLHRIGVDAPWHLWFDQDDRESKRMVLRIDQGGLGVPDRGYYMKQDKESKRVREAYQNHVVRLLGISKLSAKYDCEKARDVIVRLEKKLAKVSMTPVERRDPHARYNKYTERQLQQRFPHFNWKEYLDALNVPPVARQHIIVDNPAFLKEVANLFKTVPLEEWRTYLEWHLLFDFAGALGEKFVNERFLYQKVIGGQQKISELWKRSVSTVNSIMEDAIGKLYVQNYFPPSAKKRINELVIDLVRAYRERLKRLMWMSAPTKKKALGKLEAITLQLGYPEKWESYAKLKVTEESFVENMIEGYRFHFDREVERLAKPTDPTRWPMPPAIVNACYSLNLNQITFPAGILQPPFFYPDADDAVNYGAIGSVIGHELTHAFDDEGSKFDKHGNLQNWWKKVDRAAFEKRTRILVKQYDAFRVADRVRLNGKLTLGENIADLGGVVIAFEAFQIASQKKKQKTIDGLTPEQRFFISYAITERTLVRDEFAKFAALNDPHSPSEFRVNGVVPHSEAFYTAFDVKNGDKLYRPLSKRAVIW